MRRLAVITGASAGIGKAFAEFYAEKGLDLVLTARREDRLNRLASDLRETWGVEVFVIPLDLALETSPGRLITRIEDMDRHVDVLINNAGYGLPGTFLNTRWEDQRDFLQVMLNAPAELCQRVLPAMVRHKYGRIINVASLAGLTPGAKGHTLYGAVKSALIKLSESLNAETEGMGIHVTALCPGLTYSEFHDVNGQRDRLSDLPEFMWQNAQDVVEAAYDAVEANRAVVVTGGVNKMLAATSQIMPGPIARSIMKSQLKRFRQAD